MQKFDVGFNTETFRHFIVEAPTAAEALGKAWAAFMSGEIEDNLEDGVTTITGVMNMETGTMEFPAMWEIPTEEAP